MLQDNKLWIAQGDNPCYLLLNQANRHGLIAGASGTGKTVTLKVISEGFSEAGVPVFMADVKGDVTGMCEAGVTSDGLQKRLDGFGIKDFSFNGNPCRFWDMTGTRGIPVRVTVSQMGPSILSRLLGLTDVQEGVLNIVFRIADDKQMLLIDLKDLRSMLTYVSNHADEYQTSYGNVSSASVGAILRSLIAIEDQGGDSFFGEPSLDLNDWFACDANGKGYINILNAEKLIQTPQIYAMFLLWMLSDLFDTLPEVGDPDKPRFVFFFDEAHLLFDDMPKQLEAKIVQVVKLIRSKGVGVYFITQSPSDIPDEVLAQLSNRVQHGLRAYTPTEQKAVRVAADSFRANPKFKSDEVLQQLGTGEALVSFLDEKGIPSVVEKAKVLAPHCLMGAASDDNVNAALAAESNLEAKYGTAIDRVSAYEVINGTAQSAAAAPAAAPVAAPAAAPAPAAAATPSPDQVALEKERAALEKEKAAFEAKKQADAAKAQAAAEKAAEKAQAAAERAAEKAQEKADREAERQAAAEQKARDRQADQIGRVATSVVGQIGREASRQIVRGLLKNFKL